MALISCPECKKEVSDKALSCPNCGAPISNKPATVIQKRKTSLVTKIVLVIILISVFGAIYDSIFESQEVVYTPSLKSGTAVPSKLTRVKIDESQFDEKWPFTVSSGELECHILGDGQHAVTFRAGPQKYAVNGAAKTAAKKGLITSVHTEIEPIWREDPNYMKMVKELAASSNQSEQETMKKMGPPTRISIGPIINKGLTLCNK